jgi:hypothetical protein
LCTICAHLQRSDIDLALTLHRASYRAIAHHYGVTKPAIQRHERAHLATSLKQSQELQAMLSNDNLLAKLGEWHDRMEEQYKAATAAGEIMPAVATARVGIQAIESFSRIGQMSDLEARIKALEDGDEE